MCYHVADPTINNEVAGLKYVLCFLAELHTYVRRGVDITSVSSFDPRFLELFFETF